MGYKTKFALEWLGFLFDDLAVVWNKCREFIIPIWIGVMVISGSTALVTVAIWLADDHYQEKLAIGFWVITWIFFANLGGLFLYWLGTGAQRAHRRLQ